MIDHAYSEQSQFQKYIQGTERKVISKRYRKSSENLTLLFATTALSACGGGSATEVNNSEGNSNDGDTDSSAVIDNSSSSDNENSVSVPLEPSLYIRDSTFFSNQGLGEDAAVLDLNQNGYNDLIVFTSSHRSQYHPEQNDVAIFELTDDNEIKNKFFKIDYHYDGYDSSKISFTYDKYIAVEGDLTIGWLQDSEVSDFNSDGIDDLFFAGHGRELAAGSIDFSDSNPSDYPGDYIRVAISNSDKIKVVTVNEIPAFFHGTDVGDIDGDGDNDIVAVVSSGPYVGYQARAWLNDGSANFTKIDLPDVVELTPVDYWNLYSKDDFFVSSVVSVGNIINGGADEIVFARIQATGTSRFELIHIVGWNGTKLETVNQLTPNVSELEEVLSRNISIENLHVDKIAIEDIDGDGDDDIALKIIYDDDYLLTLILENLDGKNFDNHYAAPNIETSDGFGGGDGPTLIDLNNDGHLDLVNAGWIGATFWPDFIKNVWLNDGNFNFVPLTNYINPETVDGRFNSQVEGNVQFNVIKNGDQALFIVRGGHVFDDNLETNIQKISLVSLENLDLINVGVEIV